jgi:F1F0 ATPase subunit 2
VNEIIRFALAGGAGLFLGAVFFGGLWLTVRWSVTSERPALWFITSFVVRMSIVLTGVYLVSGRDWRLLAICLVGCTISRMIVMRLSRQPEEERNPPGGVASRAP